MVGLKRKIDDVKRHRARYESQNNADNKFLIEKYKRQEALLTLLDTNQHEAFWEQTKKYYQGGLSDMLFDNSIIKQYAEEHYGELVGYFEDVADFRSRSIDEYMESQLTSHGIPMDDIALFLCSRECRKTFESYNGLSVAERKQGIDELITTIKEEIAIIKSLE